MEQMKENKVEINICLLPKEITEDGIVSTDKEGNDRRFKADSVVVCRGFVADRNLTDALKEKIKEVRPIGDCVESRLIYEAIHEGWVAANEI
jgi:glycerol-3-phosphate responsive antiterminator